MSIDRLNTMRLSADLGPMAPSAPAGSAQSAGRVGVASSEVSDGSAAGANAAAPRVGAGGTAAQPERAQPVPLSVVVNIQSEAQLSAAAKAPLVYGSTGKVAAPVAPEADVAAMHAAYQRAQERIATAVSALKVEPDGTVVANQSDFVSIAVSAMREYRDEVDRQQRYAQMSSATSVAPITTEAPAADSYAASPFKGLQQLASRLNFFA